MTNEEQTILNKARENLEAASLLLEQGYIEIAASRAYYAMFYATEALLLRRGLHFSSHSAVISAYGKEFAKTGDLDPVFHQYLIKAQELRQTSDYGYQETLSNTEATQVLEWARAFITAAQAYLS